MGWTHCKECGMYFVDSHKCGSPAQSRPFVLDGVFAAAPELADIPLEFENLRGYQREHSVFVHPATLAVLDGAAEFGCAGLLLLEDHSHLLVAVFTSASVDESSLIVPRCSVYEPELARCQRVSLTLVAKAELLPAPALRLTMRGNCQTMRRVPPDDHPVKYLSRGGYVLANGAPQLRTRYLGQTAIYAASTDGGDLANDLSRLSLTPSSSSVTLANVVGLSTPNPTNNTTPKSVGGRRRGGGTPKTPKSAGKSSQQPFSAAPRPQPIPIAWRILPDTVIDVQPSSASMSAAAISQTPPTIDSVFGRLCGLRTLKRKLHTLVVRPAFAAAASCWRLLAASQTDESGVRSILLHGTSGVGKSLVLGCVAEALRPCTHTQHQLHAHKDVLQVLALKELGRALVLLDNVDDWVCRDADDGQQPDTAVCNSIQRLLDTLHAQQSGWLLAVAAQPHLLPVALRRRFDVELEVPAPSADDRSELLARLCAARTRLAAVDATTVQQLALAAHGYTGADLESVVRLAHTELLFADDEDNAESASVDNPTTTGTASNAGNSTLTSNVDNLNTPSVDVDNLAIDAAQALLRSLRAVRPSAMKHITLEVPHVRWTDIGGYSEVKQVVQQAVEWPHKHADAFRRLGLQPPVGILLYGPPGCSKTLIARATATESRLNFLSVKGPELFSKYVGESERAIRELFKRARQAAPAIIFFDEIDALAQSRSGDGDRATSGVGDRMLTMLLTELDGLESLAGVTILGATNRPDVIDRALLRPGRLDRLIYVPLPDAASRRHILQLKLAGAAAGDVDLDVLAAETDGYSELACVAREAGMCAMRECLQAAVVHNRHVQQALDIVRPATSQRQREYFETFAAGSRS